MKSTYRDQNTNQIATEILLYYCQHISLVWYAFVCVLAWEIYDRKAAKHLQFIAIVFGVKHWNNG